MSAPDLSAAIRKSYVVLADCLRQHSPKIIYVAYSGGRDSALVLALASNINADVRVMSIDTGLSADGWQDMVRSHVAHYGLKLEIVPGAGWEWYAQNVRSYGFGYTPGAHVYYYRKLKQQAIQNHLQAVKSSHRERVVYLTGVRRAESVARSDKPYVLRHGSRVTVNMIAHWSNDLTLRTVASMGHYHNPYYDTVGNSGDCLCGWTCRNTAEKIAQHYPIIGGKLIALSDELERAGGWRYGVRGDVQENNPPTMPDDSLCAACGVQQALPGF